MLNAFNDLRTRSFSCDTKVPTFRSEPQGDPFSKQVLFSSTTSRVSYDFIVWIPDFLCQFPEFLPCSVTNQPLISGFLSNEFLECQARWRSKSPVTLQDFAILHQLHRRHDPAGDHIPGSRSHIFYYSAEDSNTAEQFGVTIRPPTAHRWRVARAEFRLAGMIIRENGDNSGTATFNPSNPEHVRLVLKHARPKRQIPEVALCPESA
jgi:hypothetical protein